MGKAVLILIITLIIVMAALFLFLSILSDLKSAQIYKNANQSIGKVKHQLESGKVNAYGSGAVGMRRRTYQQYEVEYQAEGKTYTGVLQTKEKNLGIGDEADVRYIWNRETNEPEIVSGAYADRLKELTLGGVFGVILAAGIIILKVNGRI